MILLVTGGSGSGKSTYAEKVIRALPARGRVYIATMQVCDEESRQRVLRHQRQRAGLGFLTLEQPMDLAACQIPDGAAVLLEDLPNLLANEMFSGGDPDRILPALRKTAEAAQHLIMVTNDVFSDGIHYPESVEQYRRRLAALNTEAARLAECAAEIIYSIPVPIKGALPCISSSPS